MNAENAHSENTLRLIAGESLIADSSLFNLRPKINTMAADQNFVMTLEWKRDIDYSTHRSMRSKTNTIQLHVQSKIINQTSVFLHQPTAKLQMLFSRKSAENIAPGDLG